MKSAGWKIIFVVALALALLIPVLAGPAAAQTKAPVGSLTAKKSLGSPSAPITVEVFADFQCPQCRLFFLTTTQQLIDSYVSTGKVYLVHHDFPLNMHSHSHQAAEWANAAAIDGKFEMAERALYEKQDTWGPTGQIEEVLAGVFPAADMKKIRDIESTQLSEIDAAIQSDMALGNSRNVNGTPTIYVTHRGQTTMLPQGGVNWEILKQYLDYLLAH
jgi:protein-disulfide isomerase